jgi:hypothetical protein
MVDQHLCRRTMSAMVTWGNDTPKGIRALVDEPDQWFYGIRPVRWSK